jgi:predicted nucleic acid-binding protein
VRVVDSSVAIAAFAEWNRDHDAAHRAIRDQRTAIAAHAAVETYSVLTRLPEPHTMEASVARAWLADTFADRWLGLSVQALQQALERFAEQGISGGATYDGLIATTARANKATLVTLDRRALPTYALVGADVELVA